MKRLSLQWRITLMTVLLIGVTCVVMNLLLCSSGVYYMDTIADTLQGGDTVMMNSEGAESFNPQLVTPDEDLTIVVNGAQGRFRMTNWYITAAVTLLSGVLAYFVSGRALKPLRSFVSQVEKVQLNNLADMRINENVHRQRCPRAAHAAGTDAGAAGAVLRGASRYAAGNGEVSRTFAGTDGATDTDDQNAA